MDWFKGGGDCVMVVIDVVVWGLDVIGIWIVIYY